MLKRVLILGIVLAVAGGAAYEAIGSALAYGDPDRASFTPLLLPLGILIGMTVMRPKPRSFVERGQSKRWRNLTRSRWMGIPQQDYRRFWLPPNWGSQNWLTRAEGKRIVNIDP